MARSKRNRFFEAIKMTLIAIAVIVILPVAIALLVIVVGPFFLLLRCFKWACRRLGIVPNGKFLGWSRMKFGGRYSVEELARRLDVSVEELTSVEPTYRSAPIPKRSGGTRMLFIPDDATKRLQRKLLNRVFRKLKAHPAAVGFERGKSIVDNARPHVGRAVVIKLDIKDFFDNTSAARLDEYFRRIGWKPEAAALLVKLTTHDGRLPQGAPTSPRLSNLVNYGIDRQFELFAEFRRGYYTRYADDITFSFPKDYPKRVRGVVQRVRRVLKSRGYQLNGKKVRILRRHQRQCVTGLVVNDKVQLPRSQRRRLRAIRHHLATGREATMTPAQLGGWESLEAMIQEQRDRKPE